MEGLKQWYPAIFTVLIASNIYLATWNWNLASAAGIAAIYLATLKSGY